MSLRLIRECTAALVAVSLLLTPAEAAQWSYFRMKSPTGQIVDPGTPTNPGGQHISYSINGPSTATTGQAYSARSVVTGATGAVSYSVLSGALPSGLFLNDATGTISGVPSRIGSFAAVLQAFDAGTVSAAQAPISIQIDSPLSIVGVPSGTGTVGLPYSFGTTSTLPPGLSLGQANGLLAGTPSRAGLYSGIGITGQDVAGRTANSSPFDILISDPLSIAWTASAGRVGDTYSSSPSTSGGHAPLVFALGGSLPSGLVFSRTSGTISGTPSASGEFPVQIVVNDQDGRVATTTDQTISISAVSSEQPLVIAGSPASAGQVEVSYSANFSASGGSGVGFVFDLVGAALPDGLTLSSAGIISGVPSTAGTYSGIQVRVRDSEAHIALSNAFSIIVAGAPQLMISGNPASYGQVGRSYSADFVGFEGSGTGYTFSMVGAALPPGLSLLKTAQAQASITGVPTYIGTYSPLQVRVTDSAGHTADSNPFTITITPVDGPALTIAGSPPSRADIGTPYSATFTANGGTGGYIFDIASGSLPLGLTLSSDGILSGTPSTTATAMNTYTVRVTDSEGDVATATFTISVALPIDLATPAFPYGIKGGNYFYQLFASGGRPPYTYVVSGAFPAGLSLDPSSGIISGQPQFGGGITYGVIVTAIDSVGRTIARNANMTVFDQLTVSFNPVSGAVGEPYLVAPTVSGGAGGYVFSLADWPSGTPTSLQLFGLTLDSASGALSGTPVRSGTTPEFVYKVTDSIGMTAAAPSADAGFHHSIFIADALVISGSPAAAATVGQVYSAQLLTTGGASTASFSITSGSLPTWLSLNATTGLLSGTPGVGDIGNSGPLTVSATDGSATSASSPFSISVATAPSLTGAPPVATLGDAYSFDLETLTSGGRAPYSYVQSSGTLPAGMSLSGSVVTASQVTGQTSNAGITVTDADGRSTATSITFAVAVPTASASFTSPAQLRSGAPVTGSLATNLSGATWSFTSSPTGLNLTAVGSNVSGVAPSVASQTIYTVTAKATSGSYSAAAGPFSITVEPLLAITGGPSSDVIGDVGLPLAATPAASVGATGVGTISFALLQNGTVIALPSSCAGLSFNPSNGVISGSPSASCTATNLAIRATDAFDGATASTSAPFALTISSALTAPAGSFASAATAGTNYSSGPLTTTGGSGPYTWSIASGALPTGLTLDTSSGVLSGVPSTTGTYTFTVKRTDSFGRASPSSSAQTLTVAAATFAVTPASQAVHAGQPISGTFSSTFSAPTILVTQAPTTPDLSLTGTASAWRGTAPSVGSQTTFSVTWTAKTADSLYALVSSPVAVSIYPALSIAAVANFTGEAPNSVSFTAPAVSNKIGTANWTLNQNGSPVAISSLCAGMTFDSASGRISSASAAVCSPTNLTYTVVDSADGSSVTSLPFSITIGPAQSAPTGTVTATGIAGVAYSSASLTAHGGSAPYTWSVASGSLPGGLSLNSSTGVLTGTPNGQGTYNFTLKVTDAFSIASPASTTQTVTITQTPSNNGTYTTSAQVGSAYSSAKPATSGGPGTAPYAYHFFSGTIPPGLTLNPDGSLTGMPTAAGTYSFYVYLTDANNVSSGSAGTQTTITVTSATASGTLNAPTTVRSGAAVSGTLTSSRATPSWTIAQAPTSPALSLAPSGNTSSATFSGTAPSVGSQTRFSLSATATSNGTSTGTGTIGTLTVNPPLAISAGPTGTVAGSVGNAITASSAPSVSGLVGTATFALLQSGSAVTLSSACPGLSFSTANGVISGTPTATCNAANLTIRISDSNDGATATTSSPFGITMSAGLSAPTGSFSATGVVGNGYSSGPLSASGGVAPYSWSVASGAIPAGLILDAATGIVAGTPTTAGAATFALKVVDSQGYSSAPSASQTITIVNALSITTQPSSLIARVGTPMNSVSTGVTVSGGAGMYTWSISPSGVTLPPGATASSTGGSITWSSPVSGTTSGIKLRVTDSLAGSIDTSAFSLIVNPALTISGGPSSTISGVPNSAIAATPAPSVSNKVGTVSYALLSSGSPITLGVTCPGLVFHTDTGVIDGTPSSSCTAPSLTIRATDTDGATAATQTSFAVVINPSLTITLGAIPAGATSSSYSYVPNVTGGTGTYSAVTVTNVTGTLGALGLSASIVANQVKFSGTPTSAGSWTGTFTVTDSGGNNTASAQFTITVTAALTMTYNVPLAVNTSVGGAFQATASTAGGSPPYTYWIVNDASSQYKFSDLGLTFNPATGSLTGPITVASRISTGVVGVRDSAGNQATASISVSAASPSANVFGGTMTGQYQVLQANTTYSASLTLTGGVTPYRYFYYSGTLPTGVTITQSNNTWSGTATTPGQYTYVVQAGDANFNYFTTQTYYATVYSSTSPQLAVSPNSQMWDVGQTGRTFSLTPYGSGPFTFQAPTTISGALPAGLSFVQASNVASGAAAVVVSGTPTAAGSWTGTFTAKDSGNRTATSVTVTITVNASPTIAGTPPSGKVGTAYAYTPRLGGGTPYYSGFTATLTSGSTLAQLGLAISSTTGAITGTPTAAGTWNGTISYVDGMGQTATNSFSITIAP
jgi:Putative Ig domain